MVLMYDRSSESTEVDDVTRQRFTQKSRILESIPPTQAALKQHIKLTCYQANTIIVAVTVMVAVKLAVAVTVNEMLNLYI